MKELDLSESQKRQYEELKQELKTRLRQGCEKRKQFLVEVENEINKANPDLNAVALSAKQKVREFPSAMEGYMDLMLSCYNMLDKEQQEKVIGKIREMMERHRKCFRSYPPTSNNG
ncbi:MAG: Spy/CpxP family protein refolding chaperone [Deltaproteobacteria bacterium]|nr:Spy/CpxP family protein refolding chaperone [Deltaproteobacteria bacterium]